jgi:hypothetical protein
MAHFHFFPFLYFFNNLQKKHIKHTKSLAKIDGQIYGKSAL